MASYKSRVIDVTIVNRLRNKGAILVEGAKWCGKTTTCEQHASSRKNGRLESPTARNIPEPML